MYIVYQVSVSKFDESEFQEKQNSYIYIEKMYAASIVLFTNRDTFKYYYIIFDLN